MSNTVTRFQGRETVGRKNIWKILQKFLGILRSGEKSYTAETWLRTRRSLKDDRLRAVSMHNPSTFDVD